MNAPKTSLATDTLVDAVPRSSDQTNASPTPTVSNKPAVKVPDGYKIVKVRKPDGTIMKVLRPIAKDGAPYSSLPKSAGESAQTSTGAPFVSQTRSKVVLQATKGQAALPGKQGSQKEVAEKSPGTITSEAIPKQTELKPKETNTPPAHTSKLDAVSKSARHYRRFHRFHEHASTLVQAFDPYSDVGDYEDGDQSIPDDSNSQSDDSDKDDEEHHHNSATESATHRATTSTVNHAINNRQTPTVLATKTGVSVHEIPGNKSTSTELTKEAFILEKALPIDLTEDSKAQEHILRGLSRHSIHWAKLITWALVILFPLAFIACLDKKPTTVSFFFEDSDYNYEEIYSPTTMSVTLLYATKAAITAWPIVFAAILTQTLRATATYQVERGIRLMNLEQMISSHSVSGAIKQPFVLRRVNWLTVGLMGLWALSPLGSQAMQYTTNQMKNMNISGHSIYYLDTTQENPGLSGKWEADVDYSDSMDVLYAAVFQQKTEYQPAGSDPWGNALIPVYEYLVPTNASSSDPPPITTIDPFTTKFSSYYGIPLAYFNEYDGSYSGTWNFTIQSSYLYLDCPFLHFETLNQIDLDLQKLGMSFDQLSNDITGSLYMDLVPPDTSDQAGNVTFVSSCSTAQTPNGTATYAYAFCGLSQTFVESGVSCLDTNCTVVNITKLTAHQPTVKYDFINEFLKASNTGQTESLDIENSTFSMTELWIRDPDNATDPGPNQYCDLSPLSPLQFTKRLAFLLNTFYSTGFTHDFTVGSLTPNDTISLSDGLPNTNQSFVLTNKTQGVHQYQIDAAPFVFSIDWRFIALFEFCAVMLLLIGIVGILLESKTISPDILSFTSNLARSSKYVKLPKVDGPMNKAERARKLGDVKVMMQEVRGKVVLGNVHESVTRLSPGKSYR